jgi:hypothetical protein
MRRDLLTDSDIAEFIENARWRQVEVIGAKTFHHAWVTRAGQYVEVVYTDEGRLRVIITAGLRPRLPRELR